MDHLAYFIFLMVVGTFCFGVNDVIKKKVLGSGLHPLCLLGTVWTGAGLILLVAALLTGAASPRAEFWAAVAVTFPAALVSQALVYTSFAKEEASLMSPLRLVTPPIVLLTGFLFLGERPSVWGAIGVLTTFIGLWWLLTDAALFRKISLRAMLANKGVLLGLTGSVIVGFSFPFDKKAVLASSSLFYSWWMFLTVGVVSLGWFVIRRRLGGQWAILRKGYWGTIVWLVILNVLGGWLTFEALKFSSAAYAANMKRLWPLWAVLLSGKFLAEGNISKKVIATLIMLSGIALTLVRG